VALSWACEVASPKNPSALLLPLLFIGSKRYGSGFNCMHIQIGSPHLATYVYRSSFKLESAEDSELDPDADCPPNG
jgi:hypothetical protein